MITLQNGELRVVLDSDRPRVISYHFGAASEMHGCEAEGALTINGELHPWSAWEMTPTSAGQQGRSYDLAHREHGWSLRISYALEGASLKMRLEVTGDPQRTLRTIAFAQLPLLTCRDSEFTCWRENWIQGHWDEMDAPWPQPQAGIYACNRYQQHAIKYMLPDSAPQPTVHACLFNGSRCVFLHSNYPHLPLATKAMESTRYPQRCDGLSLFPNEYQYRVRDRVSPPLEVKVVFLKDLNGDGVADECDYHLWLNRQFPAPVSLYGDRVWYKVANAWSNDPQTTFAQTLDIIRAIHNVTDGLPQMLYLVGWQYVGHDTGFPSLDKINPAVGTREELLELVRKAKELDCIISYHINVDDAYKEFPGWDDAIISRDVDGSLMKWSVFSDRQSYHINHTQDVESGKVFARLDKMLELIPVEQTIHLDAFRYTDFSWKDGQFIGPMEELTCGVIPIVEYFRRRGIDVSVEATNNWAMDCPGLFSAVFHFDDDRKAVMYHGKLLGGGRNFSNRAFAIGSSLDTDLDYGRLQNDWPRIIDWLFLGGMLYRFYLKREMVELRKDKGRTRIRYGDGVRVEHDGVDDRLLVTWGRAHHRPRH